MAKYRAGRINEEIKKEISNIIQNDLRDPRINTAMISVVKADVTKDLKYAKIYISIFDKDNREEEIFSIIKNSSSFIRKEVSQRIDVRCTPELIFQLDKSIEQGMHIDELIEKIKGNKHNDNEWYY